MEHAILIQDFFDGRTDESKEDDLFLLLSMNREIRREFKNHLTIESVLKNDSRKLMPMASTTLGVFSRIGYEFPQKSIPSAGKNADVIQKQNFFRKYTHSIYTGFAAALITSIIFLLLMNRNEMNSNTRSVPVSAGKEIIKDGKDIQNGNDFQAGRNNISGNEMKPAEKPVKIVYITKHDTVIADAGGVGNNESTPMASVMESHRFNTKDINKILNLNRDPASFSLLQDNRDIINSQAGVLRLGEDEEESVFSIGLACSQDWALNGQAVREAYLPKFNNWGISAFYTLSNAFSIGLDFRKEFFNQIYDGFDAVGDAYIYKQNTNYISWGLAGKYKFYNYKAFDSYGQLTVGGNQAGPVVRLQTGIDYRPGLNNSYYLGIEGSVLNFYHNSKTFYAPKIGITFGTAFGL